MTLVTYAIVVFLAARNTLFLDSAFERRESRLRRQPEATKLRDVSPERRARWLPRGETRQKVEAALEIRRRTAGAIQESDDVVQAVLDDAVPKLDEIAERLIDDAHTREKVADAIQDLEASPGAAHHEGQDTDLAELEKYNEVSTVTTKLQQVLKHGISTKSCGR